jgi:hypothetical protein
MVCYFVNGAHEVMTTHSCYVCLVWLKLTQHLSGCLIHSVEFLTAITMLFPDQRTVCIGVNLTLNRSSVV